MAKRLNIAVVLGSTRDGRLNDQVAKLIISLIGSEHNVETLDPKTVETSNTQQSMNFFVNPGAVPQYIKDYNEKLKKFDAFVFVCPEYNLSLPPGLTNMFDNFPPPTFVWKPCGLVNYSISKFGGIRAGTQLSTFTRALGMMPVPKQIGIPMAHEKIDKDGKTTDKELIEEINILLQHVYWVANAFNNHKKITPGPQWAI